jgi:hypothetical protein
MTRTTGGKYYADIGGRLREVRPVEGEPPEAVICRRVADYPGSVPPAGAMVGRCLDCDASIVYDPRGPHPGVRRICMQCARIQPLPFEAEG